eukprot:467599_1
MGSAGCCSTANNLQHEEYLLSHLQKNQTIKRDKVPSKPQTIETNIDPKQYESLQQELAEYKKKCNDLQTENMELILTLNKFLTAHQSWDYETVCEWIITIENGMFQPYKDILLTNLESEEITGKDLCELDEKDLERLGITSSDDQKLLLSHIKTLTQYDTVTETEIDSDLLDNINMRMTTFHRLGTQVMDSDTLRTMSTQFTQMDFDDIKRQYSYSMSTDETFTKNMSIYNDKQSEIIDENIEMNSNENNKWNYMNGLLVVKVIKCIELNGIEEKSEIYVDIGLKSDHWKNKMTKMSNESDLVWNEEFEFNINDVKNDIVNVRIWRKRMIYDEKIGIVCIAVMDVLDSNGIIDKEYDIMESKYGGKLELELVYKEEAN